MSSFPPAEGQPWLAPLPPPRRRSSGAVVWTLALLPVLTLGLAAWVPPVWAATRRPGRERAVLLGVAAACMASVLAGVVLLGRSPVDETDTPVGLGSDIGVALLFLGIVAGTWTAVQQRHAESAPLGDAPNDAIADSHHPVVRQALAARRTREQFRGLAARDPALAREMALGRPDLRPTYFDGGLLDLNALPADALQHFARLSPQQAQQIIDVRQQLGGLSSVDELVVHGTFDLTTAERLREYALFL